jgi:hypothetical protein
MMVIWGWRYTSDLEHLPSMHQAPGSILKQHKTEKKKVIWMFLKKTIALSKNLFK